MSGSQQTRQGYVLRPNEGEHLIRNAGSLFIKVDPSRGSNNMALGTQQVPIGAGIRVHQHREADEVLFVLEGAGFGILDGGRAPIEVAERLVDRHRRRIHPSESAEAGRLAGELRSEQVPSDR